MLNHDINYDLGALGAFVLIVGWFTSLMRGELHDIKEELTLIRKALEAFSKKPKK